MGYRMDNETASKFKLDASESLFISRELTRVRTTLYRTQFAPLKGRLLVPTNTEMAPWERIFEYWEITPVGVAAFITDYSADLPRVDMFMTSASQKVKDLGDAYAFNINELQKASRSKVNLQQQKPLLAREAIEQAIDRIVMYGDAVFGLKGLFNLSGTITYVVPNGASAASEWESKTSEEIFADLCGICNGIVTATKEVEQPDTILLPLTSYMLISQKRMFDAGSSDHTILTWFKAQAKESVGTGISGITNIIAVQALETAGSGGVKRMMAYRKDPSKLELLVPREFEQMPPERQNLELVTNCVATCGGIVCYLPMSVSYGDGI